MGKNKNKNKNKPGNVEENLQTNNAPQAQSQTQAAVQPKHESEETHKNQQSSQKIEGALETVALEKVEEVPKHQQKPLQIVNPVPIVEMKSQDQFELIQREKSRNQLEQNHEQILIQIPESRKNLQPKTKEEDIQINVETSVEFQHLSESREVSPKFIKIQISPEQMKEIKDSVPISEPKDSKVNQIDSLKQQPAEVPKTQEIKPQIPLIKPVRPKPWMTKAKKQQPKEESLLLSQSSNSDFIKKSSASEVFSQVSEKKSQIPSQEPQSEADAVAPMFNSVKTESIKIQSDSLLLQQNLKTDNSQQPSTNLPMQELKKEVKQVESIIIESINNEEPRQDVLSSNQTTQSLLLSSGQSQPAQVLTPQELEELRAKNQEQERKRKKLKQQQEHEKWTRFYEQKRKRQEEERKRYDQEMRRIKEEEEKRKLRQQKQQIEREDCQIKKNLQKLKEIKRDVDEESPLAVKLGISVAASLAIGGITWFRFHNRSYTAIGAIASFAIAFIRQK